MTSSRTRRRNTRRRNHPFRNPPDSVRDVEIHPRATALFNRAIPSVQVGFLCDLPLCHGLVELTMYF